MPVLAVETPRLLLRLPKLSDAEPFMEIFWDPEVVEKKQVTTSPPGDIDLARRQTATLINHWELRGFGLWTVMEKATGQVIGSVGLQNWKGWPGTELAWVIHRFRWGHGLGTEAVRAALNWGWEKTEINHIISLINPDDLRSIHIASKIGEQFERADVDPIHGAPVHVYGIHRAGHDSRGS